MLKNKIQNLSQTICSEFLSSGRTIDDFKNILIRNKCDKDTFETLEQKKLFMRELNTQLISTFQNIGNDVKESLYKQAGSTSLDESQEALLEKELKKQLISISAIAIDSICGWTDELNNRKTLSQKRQKGRF